MILFTPIVIEIWYRRISTKCNKRFYKRRVTCYVNRAFKFRLECS